jgi:hypothetical protein
MKLSIYTLLIMMAFSACKLTESGVGAGAPGSQETTDTDSSQSPDSSSGGKNTAASKDSSDGDACTPIYYVTENNTAGEQITEPGMEYCYETIIANDCQGNFCVNTQDHYWTTNPKLGSTTQSPDAPTSNKDTVAYKDSSDGDACTPIYYVTERYTTGPQVTEPGMEYCYETIKANQCQGNFCLTTEDKYWTANPDLGNNTQSPDAPSDSNDTVHPDPIPVDTNIVACTMEYNPVCGLTYSPTQSHQYKIYSNPCLANAADASIVDDKYCETDYQPIKPIPEGSGSL